jgi:hypothetical protein
VLSSGSQAVDLRWVGSQHQRSTEVEVALNSVARCELSNPGHRGSHGFILRGSQVVSNSVGEMVHLFWEERATPPAVSARSSKSALGGLEDGNAEFWPLLLQRKR